LQASKHSYTIVVDGIRSRRHPANRPTTLLAMSPFWIWTQVAIIVFVVIGMIVAVTKLA
jgi:hypothetical protein